MTDLLDQRVRCSYHHDGMKQNGGKACTFSGKVSEMWVWSVALITRHLGYEPKRADFFAYGLCRDAASLAFRTSRFDIVPFAQVLCESGLLKRVFTPNTYVGSSPLLSVPDVVSAVEPEQAPDLPTLVSDETAIQLRPVPPAESEQVPALDTSSDETAIQHHPSPPATPQRRTKPHRGRAMGEAEREKQAYL